MIFLNENLILKIRFFQIEIIDFFLKRTIEFTNRIFSQMFDFFCKKFYFGECSIFYKIPEVSIPSFARLIDLRPFRDFHAVAKFFHIATNGKIIIILQKNSKKFNYNYEKRFLSRCKAPFAARRETFSVFIIIIKFILCNIYSTSGPKKNYLCSGNKSRQEHSYLTQFEITRILLEEFQYNSQIMLFQRKGENDLQEY